MEIVKIDRGSIEIKIEGHLLHISGEAMLPKEASTLTEYVLYKDTLHWIDNSTHPVIAEEPLFAFLEAELLKRSLVLILE